MENKLFPCSQETFWNYVKKNVLEEMQGEIFHSNDYIDLEGNKLAYRETSSWSIDVIYEIAEETNDDTLNLVTNILNGE